MSIFAKTPELATTPFSEFIRNAPAKEKKRVYADVLKRANDRQQRVLAKLNAIKKADSQTIL